MNWKVLILSVLLSVFCKLTHGEDYLISRVEGSFGFPTVQLLSGNTTVRTSIPNKKRLISPYRSQKVCCRPVETPKKSAGSINVTGSPAAVYGKYAKSFFPLLPVSALGTDYIVSVCHLLKNSSSVLVVATHREKTDISITFRLNGTLTFDGQDYSDGNQLNLSLDTFEARTIKSSFDLTGTIVRSSHSIAVYSGLVYANNLHAYNQILPVKHYGQEYVVAVGSKTDERQLQIISNHSNTRIKFNNGSTLCMGERRVYHGVLSPAEHVFFVSSVPVMAMICRVPGLSSVVIPSVKSYNQNATLKVPGKINILTEKKSNVTVIGVLEKKSFSAYNGNVDWEDISDTNYRVGTLIPGRGDFVYISSGTSYFSTLATDNKGRVYTGGYNFTSKEQVTEPQPVPEGVCSESQTTDGADDITTFMMATSVMLGETVTDNDNVTVSDFTLTKRHNFISQTTASLQHSGGDIITTAVPDLDDKVTDLEKKYANVNVTSQTVKKVLKRVTQWLKNPTVNFSQSQQKNNVANRLLKFVDGITDRLLSNSEEESKFTTDDFVLTVVDLTNRTLGRRLPIGLHVSEGPASDDVELLYKNNGSSSAPLQSTAVFFEEEFLRDVVNSYPGKNIRLAMNYYSNTTLFTASANSSRKTLKTKAISAKILVDSVPLTDLQNLTLRIAFPEIKSLNIGDPHLYSCVYWNFSGDANTGSWSTDGCQFAKYEEQTVCVCDHLTNFAVLIDHYGQKHHVSSLALNIITKVGLALSILGLSITVISYVLFREKRLAAETRPSSTLFNLALAQLSSWIVFLAGIEQTENHVGCIVVAALLHYFILASFMWMLAMAVLYYLLIVKVLGTQTTRYMLKIGILAWGIPLLPVVTLLAVDKELYKGGKNYCWMSLIAFKYAFGAPVGLILLTNSVLYIMVVASMCKRTASKSPQTRSYLQNIKASFFSFVILGLSWIFGFLAISDARLVFQYIFCITSSIQGFLIFLFFTLHDKRIRDSWRNLCFRTKTRMLRSIRKEKAIPIIKSTDDTLRPSNFTEETV